ncbi:MAG: SUF system NifU family Fe-S cluster assembly protein [Oscillospiraceae bacterium]|jgi:nitrogen fixation NifU-like protein|nr:SUF system NifU family Fe-S cluster assembly protein [Oscillospiraceae bacterium]
MAIDSVYTQLITEHSKDKRNRREIESPTCCHHGVNPSCGDELELKLRVKGSVVEDVAFMGVGCAISQASASMMSDLLRGRSIVEANRLAELFLAMIKGEVTDPAVLEELEEAVALQGVSKMPARVKCAVLPWHTYQAAVREGECP